MKKKVLFTLILGLSTTCLSPALNAYATESYEVSTVAAQNGWDYDGTNWYFYENGQKKTGWYYENDKDTWYYLNNSGAMLTGWQKIDGKWFYFNPTSDGTRGAMKTGWLKDGGYWYYLNPKSDGTRGAMLTGWIKVDNKDYYLNPNEGGPQGAMASNQVVEGKYYVNSSGEWVKPKKSFTVEATAYAGDTMTATGVKPCYNPNGISTIAVDPRVIPLGTLVYVHGYGIAIAADTGGAIKGNRIDVFLNSESACYTWGRKNVTIDILEYR